MGALRSLALELAGVLEGEGIRATPDVTVAMGNRPAVLIPPPRVDYTQRLITWTLVILAESTTGDEDAWLELDDLLESVEAVIGIEQADPGAYNLPTGAGSVPAYSLTYRSSL